MAFYIFLIIGAFSGFLAGLLGLGGGVFVVPALAAAFSFYHLIPPDQLMQMAVGTSFATLIITFLASLYVHIKRKSVRWDFVMQILPTLIIGVLGGSVIAHHLPSNYLRMIFCIFLLVMAWRLLLPRAQPTSRNKPNVIAIAAISFLVGVLSSFLAVWVVVILIPFLLSCQLNMRQATGTSVACGLAIGVVATVSFMLLGRTAVDLPWSTGYIYWPAFLGIAAASMIFVPLGTALAYRLPTELLKRLLGLFLILVAIEMLFFH